MHGKLYLGDTVTFFKNTFSNHRNSEDRYGKNQRDIAGEYWYSYFLIYENRYGFRVEVELADAIETSVANSLSQDYTNLDDLPSPTCTDSPGFTPFTLITLVLGGEKIRAEKENECFNLFSLFKATSNAPLISICLK